MKRFVTITSLLVIAVSAHAGTLLVSGDSNIGNALNVTDGASADNNAAFFSNLLGSGTSVVFQKTGNTDTSEVDSENGIIGYYSGLSGVSVSSVSQGATPTLTSASLFIGFLQDAPYSATEVANIKAFLAAGGTVLLTGEWGGFDSTADNYLNTLLAALGSGMSLDEASLDLGFHNATGSQIQSGPFTSGVASFAYAATSGVQGGTSIFETTGGPSFLSYESTTATTLTPEPTSAWLLLAGALGLTLIRKTAKQRYAKVAGEREGDA